MLTRKKASNNIQPPKTTLKKENWKQKIEKWSEKCMILRVIASPEHQIR